MGYIIPEVICFSKIPTERLSVELVIPGSEMDKYIATGKFDPAALEKDKKKAQERDKRQSELFQTLML
jgi:hypothetical protein